MASLPDADDFSQQWRKQLGLDEDTKPGRLEFPREFHKLMPEAKRADAFWNYLFNRGYTWDESVWVAETYNLHYALSGRYAYRIIIPVTDAQGRLLTWTARSLDPKADIRYMTLSKDFALAPPGDLLLGLQLLWQAPLARCLVICEGPFDALAVSALGHDFGVWGTCFFGLEASVVQANLLAELDVRFERMRVIIDPAAWLRMLALRSRLPKRCVSGQLPKGLKDPGELIDWDGGRGFLRSLVA